jgi:hypothetical protein
LNDCCIFPLPIPPQEVFETCFKQPDCSGTTCFDEKSMFQDQGKIQPDKIVAPFEQAIARLQGPAAEWMTVLKKSIETCQENSEAFK